MLSIAFAMLIVNCHIIKADVTELQQDDKGRYCISTADDYYFFENNCQNTLYNESTVVLTNDIEIINKKKNKAITKFSGKFDGQGHIITYSAPDRANNTSGLAALNFILNPNGVIENVKVHIAEEKVYIGDTTSQFCTALYMNNGTVKGLQVSGNVTLVYTVPKKSLKIGATQGKGILEDCDVSINYDMEENIDSEAAANGLSQSGLWEICQFGASTSRMTYKNCISHGSCGKKIYDIAELLSSKLDMTEPYSRGIYATVALRSSTACSATNLYYNNEVFKDISVVNNFTQEKYALKKFENYEQFGKTTAELKNKDTYEGFDFEKKWSISPDLNDGYPYYDPRVKEITLEVQADAEPKVWKTNYSRNYNRFKDYSTNYHFPYRVEIIDGKQTSIYDDGDNNKVTINGAKIVNQTKETQELIDKYGIKAVCNPETDIESAIVDTRFLGQRPLTVKWIKEPVLQFGKGQEAQAKEDGYTFKIKVIDGTCEVKDDGAVSAADDSANWGTYLTKAEKAIKIILDYCKDKKNAFGPKDSPSYENTDIWAIFTAARCGYVPYDDNTYFDRWFANTKIYLQELKDSGSDLSTWQATDLSKLILAIEAIGYDPRDISSVNLLDAVGNRNGDNYLNTEYAIHAIKSGAYTSSTFNDDEIIAWVHKEAKSLINAEDNVFVNADNTMSWQPLVYWYGKEGFEDVTNAVDQALHKLPEIAQRATGSFCTAGFETGCMSYGNNAWNDAQALIFASIFDVNVLDRSTGFTKNGNNFLDAFFDLVDVNGEVDGSIHGFTNYDVPQIARGLNAFVRQRKGQSNFWDFSDVTVQTRKANDLILALDDNSTKAQITAARSAYDALDDAHKAIFNKDTLKKLMDAEGKGEAIEKVVKAIDAIPAADQLTLEDKKKVEKARTLYDALDAESQAAVSNYSKLTEAEEKIAELEEKQAQETADKKAAESVSTAIASLPTAENLTLSDYVLKRLDEVQAAYDALTETQKALVENYETLQTLRTVAADKKAAAEVAEKISAIGTLNAGNHEQKQALVTEARTAYEGLTEVQKSYVANYGVLEKAELFLSTCEKDEQAAYVMGVIDELNTVSKTMADGPLKLTEKNNGVPTEEIWKDWENYVVNARAQYTALDASQQEQVENLSDLEVAEGYVYQVKAETLKAQLEALPDATTVKGYEAQPTETPETPETTPAPESPAETAEFDADAFSDGSTDAAVETQNAEVQDVFSAEESGVDTDDTDATVQDADVVSAEVQNETGVDVETATAEKTAGSENTAVTADAENEATETAEAVAEDTENADAIPAADSTSAPAVSETDTFSAAESEEADTPSTDLRALTDEELVQIITAKNSYEQLATAEEEKFRAENTALVENLEKLVSLALTYPSAEETYLQQFTAEAAQLYTSVNPVSRDTYAAVKALLDRYEKDYQSYADAMASLKAEVNGQELTFAELLNSLKEQTAKVEKDTADAAEADERILNLPTAVTKDNIHEVEAELASLQKFLDNMSEEARTYMWQKSQLTLVRTIVADYHVDLADKKDTFKSSRPKNLKTKVLNYKTIQVSWTGTDYADSYNVYRKTGTGSWKKIASGITGVSYKDTKAVTGTTYTYTVRAVSYTWGKAVLSKYDQTGVKGKAKLTAPTFTSVKTAGKNTVKATWKKVTGASGYRVYRSTSKNGKYTSAGLIKKGSTVTFKDKKVSKGKTYYYKVRAYRAVNGKRVYGPYSTVKSVKAK